jgi:hypothetical protein
MVAVLDQFEIEYKESYISGTYDQVVMGNMIVLTTSGGKKKYIYGNRGVVYGSINSNQSQQPGIGLFDFSTSVSYRSQPYKEKAGNCRASKHSCYNERIYDTLAPDAIACFKRNGAEPFFMTGSSNERPGHSSATSGVDNSDVGFIMFDNFVPSVNGNRSNFNGSVDKKWTRSFPFEPRYLDVSRKSQQKFLNGNIEAPYHAQFLDNTQNNFVKVAKKRKVKSLVVGTVGPNVSFSNRHCTLNLNGNVLPTGQNWYHHWVVDRDVNKKINSFSTHFLTGSCPDGDMLKVLFGYGDINTVIYSSSYVDSNNATGYAMRGTNNWPDFRLKNNTNSSVSLAGSYEQLSGSIWNISPIIRGWKYGLHSALEDYTSAYYRQGRYGQFRDMLEQRKFTKIFSLPSQGGVEAIQQTVSNSPVTVKFVDMEGNITNPENTQSQNLSFEATSSLPYFDLISRNRHVVGTIKSTNLKLINFSVDGFGNTMV